MQYETALEYQKWIHQDIKKSLFNVSHEDF